MARKKGKQSKRQARMQKAERAQARVGLVPEWPVGSIVELEVERIAIYDQGSRGSEHRATTKKLRVKKAHHSSRSSWSGYHLEPVKKGGKPQLFAIKFREGGKTTLDASHSGSKWYVLDHHLISAGNPTMAHTNKYPLAKGGYVTKRWHKDPNLDRQLRTHYAILMEGISDIDPSDRADYKKWAAEEVYARIDFAESQANPGLGHGGRLSPKDVKVVKAFQFERKAKGNKLSTDGKRLDGHWMGGNNIAHWHKGQIFFTDLGSKAAQSVQRAVGKGMLKSRLGGFVNYAKGNPGFTKKQVIKEARAVGMTAKWSSEWGEWRIAIPGKDNEASAYYTDDNEDAVGAAKMMAAALQKRLTLRNPGGKRSRRKPRGNRGITKTAGGRAGIGGGIGALALGPIGAIAGAAYGASTAKRNPKAKTFKTGTLVKKTSKFLRSIGSVTRGPKDGIVLGSSGPRLLVAWSDGHTYQIAAANVQKTKKQMAPAVAKATVTAERKRVGAKMDPGNETWTPDEIEEVVASYKRDDTSVSANPHKNPCLPCVLALNPHKASKKKKASVKKKKGAAKRKKGATKRRR